MMGDEAVSLRSGRCLLPATETFHEQRGDLLDGTHHSTNRRAGAGEEGWASLPSEPEAQRIST